MQMDVFKKPPQYTPRPRNDALRREGLARMKLSKVSALIEPLNTQTETVV